VKLENLQRFLKNKDQENELVRGELRKLMQNWHVLKEQNQSLLRDLSAEKHENERQKELLRRNHNTLLPIKREYMTAVGRLIASRQAEHEQNPDEPVKPFAIAHIRLDEDFHRIRSEEIRSTLAHKTAMNLDMLDILQRTESNETEVIYQGFRLEDFLVVLEHVRNVETAEFFVAEHVIPAVIKPAGGDGNQFGCHIGLVVFPFHGETFRDLDENLDIATENALVFRRRYVVFTEHWGEQHRHRMHVYHELKIARNNGFEGFELRFQPFVDKDGRIVGCETLIRWHHPKLGFLSPDLFISLAEQYGEMSMLGRWILYQACLEFRSWKQAGHAIGYVSVNLSPVQFEQEQVDLADHEADEAGLVVSIHGMLESLGLRGDELKLEITEGAIMNEPGKSIDILNQFRAHGIRVAVDDFGSGYSSLNYLTRLPINTLKIDKSFIDNLIDDDSNRVVVKSIIDLARNLDMEILAEGVETKEQKELLFDEGIQLIQGYYYSPPVTGGDFLKLLQENDFPSR
jgi:EAL domain-containing protein (putative c-di-GMP-specific phosphodiesterase class I)